jgi:hypothetical protein
MSSILSSSVRLRLRSPRMSWKMELDLTLGFWARASEVKKKANQPAAMSCSVVTTSG